ncbi:MAG: type I-C CRISPR-associated protein Cas8c/Csd1, partial [Gammaproteobacteria bacterium]|nr:type I-C CRISPR-associated protein Cas8c/Csd1 [Gammaproteobacteria bacterium]
MILQALHDLYGRLADDDEYQIAPAGYSTQNISFQVILKPDGRLQQIADIRDLDDGKKLRPRQVLVPGQAKPSGSGLNPCFLWDNALYILGFTQDEAKRKRALPAFEAFRDRHLGLEAGIDDEGFSAVCR